jgi:hypothetical protein
MHILKDRKVAILGGSAGIALATAARHRRGCRARRPLPCRHPAPS